MTIRRSAQVMGMPISLAVRGAEPSEVDAAWSNVVASLRWVDRVFSTYRPDSAVSRLARGDLALGDCPREVAEVIALGERAEAESDGAFSIGRIGPDGPAFDPSGVVKGWAVERALPCLDILGQVDLCLSAGGDLLCRSNRPDSMGWQIGIEDPHQTSRLLASVRVHHGAVATSGRAHRGDHLRDPRTGHPATGLASVTVVGDSLTWVDIEATTAFVLGDQAAAWLASRPGRPRTGLIVDRTGIIKRFGSHPATSSGPMTLSTERRA